MESRDELAPRAPAVSVRGRCFPESHSLFRFPPVFPFSLPSMKLAGHPPAPLRGGGASTEPNFVPSGMERDPPIIRHYRRACPGEGRLVELAPGHSRRAAYGPWGAPTPEPGPPRGGPRDVTWVLASSPRGGRPGRPSSLRDCRSIR